MPYMDSQGGSKVSTADKTRHWWLLKLQRLVLQVQRPHGTIGGTGDVALAMPV
jgi:hypothetical protein